MIPLLIPGISRVWVWNSTFTSRSLLLSWICPRYGRRGVAGNLRGAVLRTLQSPVTHHGSTEALADIVVMLDDSRPSPMRASWRPQCPYICLSRPPARHWTGLAQRFGESVADGSSGRVPPSVSSPGSREEWPLGGDKCPSCSRSLRIGRGRNVRRPDLAGKIPARRGVVPRVERERSALSMVVVSRSQLTMKS